MKTLAKNPADRYHSVSDFARALAFTVSNRGVQPNDPTPRVITFSNPQLLHGAR